MFTDICCWSFPSRLSWFRQKLLIKFYCAAFGRSCLQILSVLYIVFDLRSKKKDFPLQLRSSFHVNDETFPILRQKSGRKGINFSLLYFCAVMCEPCCAKRDLINFSWLNQKLFFLTCFLPTSVTCWKFCSTPSFCDMPKVSPSRQIGANHQIKMSSWDLLLEHD